MITAISNDTGYENLFLKQLNIFHKIGDPLLVISAWFLINLQFLANLELLAAIAKSQLATS